MTGETRNPYAWVDNGQFVRAFCAADRSTHSYGWVKSYCSAPTVGIERPDGTRLNWRADLCEPADPSAAEFQCEPSWKRCPYCTSSEGERLAYLIGQYDRLLAAHERVVMDSEQDRELHARAIATFRAAVEPIRSAKRPGEGE